MNGVEMLMSSSDQFPAQTAGMVDYTGVPGAEKRLASAGEPVVRARIVLPV
jgi:hypothetical protein